MIEKIILKNLLKTEPYSRRVLPFLRDEYFSEQDQVAVLSKIREFILKYDNVPTKNAILTMLADDDKIHGAVFENSCKLVEDIVNEAELEEFNWLVDNTEKFCQDRALYNAVKKSIDLVNDDGKNNLSKGILPDLFADALAVSFDSSIGMNFLEDYIKRFDFYNNVEERIPFDIEILNKITRGGLPNKSLTVLLAGTGVGKTMIMCHDAAHKLSIGKNVLYLTAEMAEERIAERIDANLLGIPLDDLPFMDKSRYVKRIEEIKAKTKGSLYIKEYPTSSASVLDIKNLLRELKIKKKFTPDIIYVDYINIFKSARLGNAANVNSYNYIKSIAEEMRGLAMEYNLPVVTATQVNRTGFGSSDFGLTETSESFGLPATADFMLAIISTEEFEAKGQLLVKQLKNRWGAIDYYKKFLIGVDRSMMKLYNLEDSAQDGLDDSGHKGKTDSSVFDSGEYTERMENDFSKKFGNDIDWSKFK